MPPWSVNFVMPQRAVSFAMLPSSVSSGAFSGQFGSMKFFEQEELAETKNQSEDLEADKEEVEPKSLAKKEGDAEELESDEEMLQLAIAMSLAQEKEMQETKC